MKSIPHSLNFVTELDETNPTAMLLLALSEEMQITMLESMLKDLLAPVIADLNANNSFATLKVIA